MTTVRGQGGHALVFDGTPTAEIETVASPTQAWVRRSHRFLDFTETLVEEGAMVTAGQPLARGGPEFDFPLIAPVAGQVTHITDAAIGLAVPAERDWSIPAFSPVAWQSADAATIGSRIRAAGLWPTLYVAPDSEIPWRYPDDDRTPQFIVIGAARGEPHVADPRLVLQGREQMLGEAAEILRRVSGAGRVYLACGLEVGVPRIAGVEVIHFPDSAPFDHPVVQCDAVQRGAHAWGVDVQDALAIRDAVATGRVSSERLIAFGGGLVREPKHLRVHVGTPLEEITAGRLTSGRPRIIHGGLLTGDQVTGVHEGLGAACRGVNAIPEPQEREFLTFLRLGDDRDSFLNAFLANLWPDRPRVAHTGLRGERRACVNCTACQWVCPVGLMPNLLWKYSTHDMVDEAVGMGLRRCVECGLCTYVCPSKIELNRTFREAHGQVRAEAAEERAAHRAEAAAAESAEPV